MKMKIRDFNDGRGSLGYAKPQKKRRCNNCGFTNVQRCNSHKIYNSKTGGLDYCGYMRVVRYK